MFLTDQVKITKLADAAGAATSAVNGTPVDMQADGGWDGVVFMASFGTPAANNLMNAAQGDDTTTFNDLEGTAIGNANQADVLLDIYQPEKRYVRPEIARGTSTTVENIWALQYRGKLLPVSNNVASVQVAEQHVRPDEGTA